MARLSTQDDWLQRVKHYRVTGHTRAARPFPSSSAIRAELGLPSMRKHARKRRAARRHRARSMPPALGQAAEVDDRDRRAQGQHQGERKRAPPAQHSRVILGSGRRGTMCGFWSRSAGGQQSNNMKQGACSAALTTGRCTPGPAGAAVHTAPQLRRSAQSCRAGGEARKVAHACPPFSRAWRAARAAADR